MDYYLWDPAEPTIRYPYLRGELFGIQESADGTPIEHWDGIMDDRNIDMEKFNEHLMRARAAGNTVWKVHEEEGDEDADFDIS